MPSNPITPQGMLKIHADRLINRDIDQLLGICEFSLQDGIIDQYEAESIFTWLNNHKACLDTWPANILFDRLRTMLADGVLDVDEQHDLLSLVSSIARPPVSGVAVQVTTLPIDTPAPRLTFQDKTFCFTGVFDFGSRADCIAATEQRGGLALKGITKKLHYLVIGNIGSEVWKHTSFGNKIAKAVEYREDGLPVAIITETHWASHL